MTIHRFIDFTSNIANISKTTVSLSLSLSWILIAVSSTESSGNLRNAHCIQNARIYRSGGLHVAVQTDHEVSQGLGINPRHKKVCRHKKAFLLLWVLLNHSNSIDTTQWQVTINDAIAKYIQIRAMACMSKYEGPFRSSYSFLRKAEHRDRIQEDRSLCSQPKGAGGKAPKRWSSGSQQAWPAFQSKGLCL